MKHKIHKLLTLKETNRLKHRGGPRRRKTTLKRNKRQHDNLVLLNSLEKNG